MFHTILSLFYIILIIYLFTRIWQLFIRKDQKYYSVMIYLLLFLVYPVSNLLHEGGTALEARVLTAIADYLLTFFLYLFLFVLLLDLLLMINLLFRIVPRDKIKKQVIQEWWITVDRFLFTGNCGCRYYKLQYYQDNGISDNYP